MTTWDGIVTKFTLNTEMSLKLPIKLKRIFN